MHRGPLSGCMKKDSDTRNGGERTATASPGRLPTPPQTKATHDVDAAAATRKPQQPARRRVARRAMAEKETDERTHSGASGNAAHERHTVTPRRLSHVRASRWQHGQGLDS